MNLSKSVIKLVFPPHCAACRTLLPFDGDGGEVALCLDCRAAFERAKIACCPFCGAAMLDCRCLPPSLERAGVIELIRLAEYDSSWRQDEREVINRIVNNLKKTNSRDAFDFLASQLVLPLRRRLGERGVELSECVICCCPRRASAKYEHGFDQAEQLAKSIAAHSGAEYSRLLARRPFSESREQKMLTAAERYENVKDAIRPTSAAKKISGRTVLLVDDVVTTGATLAACAEILRDAGAGALFAACIAAVGK